MAYLRLSKQTEQFTALDEIHDHVQVLGILKSAPKGDQERVLASLQHAALVIGVFHLLHLDHLLLLQDLDGVEPLVMLALDQVHAAEGAGTQGALQGKVAEGVFPLCLARRVGSALLAGDVELRGGIVLGGGAAGVAVVAGVGAVMLRAGISVAVIGAVDEVPDGGHILGIGVWVLANKGLTGLVGVIHVVGLGALVGGDGGDGRAAAAGGGLALECGGGGWIEVVGALRVLCSLLLEEA